MIHHSSSSPACCWWWPVSLSTWCHWYNSILSMKESVRWGPLPLGLVVAPVCSSFIPNIRSIMPISTSGKNLVVLSPDVNQNTYPDALRAMSLNHYCRKLKRFLSKSKGCRVVKSTTDPQCKITRNKHGMVATYLYNWQRKRERERGKVSDNNDLLNPASYMCVRDNSLYYLTIHFSFHFWNE